MATPQQSQVLRQSRVRRLLLGWTQPKYPAETNLDKDEWRSQHDEISKTIWSMAWLLVASCLFCLITLGAPDMVLVNRDAKISIPFAGTQVSYTGFLLFGPLVLAVLALYLHVFVEQRLRIGRSKDHSMSPFLFNLEHPAATVLSAFLFYWMLPSVLIFFCLRALPRPEAPLIAFLTAAVTAFMTATGIRRYGAIARPGFLQKVSLGGLWVILVSSIAVLFLLVPIAWSTLIEIQSGQRDAGQWSAVETGHTSSLLLPRRRLQLFGASLEKTNLSGLYAVQADMRKADLQEADLEGADLSGADLREADLTKANLVSANLSGAKLQGAKLSDAALRLTDLHGVVTDGRTAIDSKWKRGPSIAPKSPSGRGQT
jgi:Pentapeptide repeats (8 copies)